MRSWTCVWVEGSRGTPDRGSGVVGNYPIPRPRLTAYAPRPGDGVEQRARRLSRLTA